MCFIAIAAYAGVETTSFVAVLGAFSLAVGLGTRFKVAPKIDLVAQFTYQYFFSDQVDGLQAPVIENRNNEWLLNLQFGVVYHLNFSSPLFY